MENNSQKKLSKKSSFKALSFEDAIIELEQIVKELEGGNIALNNAVEFYSRGMDLKKHCEQILAKAKMEVEKIIVENGKAVGTAKIEE